MKMSDKPCGVLTEKLKNMQTDFLAFMQLAVQTFNNDCCYETNNRIKYCFQDLAAKIKTLY